MALDLKIVVLDAMGVIYSVADDVRDLLWPFIVEKGGCQDIERIREAYIAASLGRTSSREFWIAVDMDPKLEDEYLERHRLTDGLLAFLQQMNHRGHKVWCISNDLSEWSKKLRIRFRLDEYIVGFVISGDVGIRKPEPAIFQQYLTRSHAVARDSIFIDDSERNLDSAAHLGFETVLFGSTESRAVKTHKVAMNFADLSLLLR